MVKLYCPKCMDVYTPKSSRHHHTDGAYFGTGFPHMLFMVHPEYRPKRPANQFVPRWGAKTVTKGRRAIQGLERIEDKHSLFLSLSIPKSGIFFLLSDRGSYLIACASIFLSIKQGCQQYLPSSILNVWRLTIYTVAAAVLESQPFPQILRLCSLAWLIILVSYFYCIPGRKIPFCTGTNVKCRVWVGVECSLVPAELPSVPEVHSTVGFCLLWPRCQQGQRPGRECLTGPSLAELTSSYK